MKISFEVTLSIGFPGAIRKDSITIDVDDDASTVEIEQEKELAAEEWANAYIDISWK